MNYENPERLLHMKCEQFVPEFEQQYEQLKWMDIEVKFYNAKQVGNNALFKRFIYLFFRLTFLLL